MALLRSGKPVISYYLFQYQSTWHLVQFFFAKIVCNSVRFIVTKEGVPVLLLHGSAALMRGLA